MRLRTTDVGCVTNNMLTMSYSFRSRNTTRPEKINAFNEALLARLRAMPGVRGVRWVPLFPAKDMEGTTYSPSSEHPPLKPGDGLPDAINRNGRPWLFHRARNPSPARPLFLER